VRLDHLLSKEHHETAVPVGDRDAVKGSAAVVALTGCNNKRVSRYGFMPVMETARHTIGL
jgi:hypothetical protein